jgi:predicted RNase H-like HicB family nuclease
MKEQLTAVFQKVPEGYIAFVEELPRANSQGDTLEEARSNLREAVQLVLRPTGRLQKKRWAIRRSFESHLRRFHEADRSDPPYGKARCSIITRRW